MRALAASPNDLEANLVRTPKDKCANGTLSSNTIDDQPKGTLSESQLSKLGVNRQNKRNRPERVPVQCLFDELATRVRALP